MASDLLLGLDQGSSSTKAILYDPTKRRILARSRVRIGTKRYEDHGALHVEHDPNEIYLSAQNAARQALKNAPSGARIVTGIASQRSSFLIADRKTLKPLTPVISWQDTRGLSYVSTLSKIAPEIYRKTGLYLTPYYSLTKILWLLDQDKNLRRKVDKGDACLCFIPSYLILKWTGGAVFAADPTLAQRSLLMDVKRCQWDTALLERFNIPLSFLPEIRQSRDDYGTAVFSGRTTALKAMIGDQQSAYTALQSLPGADKTALINLGTGGFLVIPTGSVCARSRGLLSGIQGCFDQKPRYMLEGTVNSIQGTLKWLLSLGFLKKSEPLEIPNLDSKEFLRRVPIVSGGFGGLAAPFWRNDIQVTVSELNRLTTRQDLFASFLLGIAHLFSEILDPLKGSPHFPQRLAASGGLSRNRGLLQILANYLNLPIHPTSDADLTALGACAAATHEKLKLPLEMLKPVKPQKQAATLLSRYKEKARAQLRLILKAA